MKAKAVSVGTDSEFKQGTIVEVIGYNGATFKFKDPDFPWDVLVGAWEDCAILDGGWWEKIE